MRANATRPSALTCGRPGMWGSCSVSRGGVAVFGVAPAGRYGLVTVTRSKDPTSSNIASIAARTSGSSTPDSARKTMEPLTPPPSPPKCSSSTSKPRLLSDSGASNSA